MVGAKKHVSPVKQDCEPKEAEVRRAITAWKRPRAKINFVNIPELIRSVQRSEGNPACFGTTTTCDRLDCAWRGYCLGNRQLRH
jgi:hypothetical protein